VRVDAHVQFRDVSRFRYPCVSDDSPLRRNYLPEHLAPILRRNRFEGAVAVAALTTPDETRWLLELAGRHDFVAGVVGWADLACPRLGHVLDEYQCHPKFKGLRHPVEGEPDGNWLLREDVIRGLGELARRGIPFGLAIGPAQLKLVPRLAERVPELHMAIEHLGKPPIAHGGSDGWASDLEAAARLPQVFCTLSGLITEADWSGWNPGQLRPYIAHALGVFGPERLMFGSDWPRCTLAGTWKEVLAAFTQAAGPLPMPTREQILGGASTRFYGLAAAAS